ncbi:MAG TPA: Rne/Rng family ribonuclease [Candidatus Binataceae bacterium]|nr:Rne/Rng family ribonuclease [Candidatus Binataceae bacterium]
MKREIVINSSALEVRVAVIEDRALAEFYLERDQRGGLAGGIFKGKVTRVLPGMQAAFVDIGLEKHGFLHVSDYLNGDSYASAAEVLGEEDVETEPLADDDEFAPPLNDEGAAQFEALDTFESDAADETHEAAPEAVPAGPHRRGRGRGRRRRTEPPRNRQPIEEQLKRGQEIIVQVAKEPMGTKGARLTSFISLPGRHLVYTPTSGRIGISRRIESGEERSRLRAAVRELAAQGGFIVRTACEGVSKKDIQRDVMYLTKLWSSIVKQAESSSPASLLYDDLEVSLRIVRDLFSSDVERIRCDDPTIYGKIVQFVQTYMPRLRSRISLYEGSEPIFDQFGIEQQLDQALDRKVWLKSGGYLIFDQAEALTAIDVNTGRFVGKHNQDETVLKTNLEAAEEVVKQLRLRNIGGIIIVDFIDMSREADRKRVTETLMQALKRDKARSSVLKISELGLVQMTRKRTRESLQEMVTQPCPICEGRSVVKSVATRAAEVIRGIQRAAGQHPRTDMLVVKVNPAVARFFYDSGGKELERAERLLEAKIILRSSENIAPGGFEMAPATAAA